MARAFRRRRRERLASLAQLEGRHPGRANRRYPGPAEDAYRIVELGWLRSAFGPLMRASLRRSTLQCVFRPNAARAPARIGDSFVASGSRYSPGVSSRARKSARRKSARWACFSRHFWAFSLSMVVLSLWWCQARTDITWQASCVQVPSLMSSLEQMTLASSRGCSRRGAWFFPAGARAVWPGARFWALEKLLS